MRLFSRRTAPEEPSSPVLPPASGNGNGFSLVSANAALKPPATERPSSKETIVPNMDTGPTIPFGRDVQTGEEVHLTLSQLKRPLHIQAGTGDGKTLLQAHLIERQIALTDAAVLCVDFGEDQAAANYVLDAAKKHGRTFRLLSTVPEHASATFNAFRPISPLTKETAVLATNYLASSLSLDHGEGQKAYWGKVNNITLLRAMNALIESGILHLDFSILAKQLETTGRGVRKHDAAEALLQIEQLAPYDILRSGDPQNEIDYDRVLENREVVYLLLGTLLNPPARAIGALNVWAAVLAAIKRKRMGLPPTQLLLDIDEYASVAAAKAFSDLLTRTSRNHTGLSIS